MVWTPIRKILFRFFVVYVFIYVIVFSGVFVFHSYALLNDLVTWVAENVFGSVRYYESKFECYFLVLITSVSLLATVVWSVLDRKRIDYNTLFRVFTIIIRYFLAYEMLTYGLAKILGTQFIALSVMDLQAPFGDNSPMGLVWQMMGYSYVYSSFTGWLEVAACLLLLIRRTQTLGAVLNLGIMANVVALNYCYDISVKMHSTHLLIFTFFLVILDAPRLWNFFVMNRPVASKDLPRIFSNGRHSVLKSVAICIIVFLTWFQFYTWLSQKEKYNQENPTQLLGVYKLKYYQAGWYKRKESEISDWKEIEIFERNQANLTRYNGAWDLFSLEIDLTQRTVQLEDSINASIINFDIISHNNVGTKLMGIYGEDTLCLKVVKMRPSDFRLMR